MSDSPYVRRLGTLALDAVLVVVFATLGARTHHDGAVGVSEVADVAWPFLVGLGLAHALRQVPWTPVSGVVVWISTVAVGMALRIATGDGTALAFVLVATGFNLLTLVGWRLLALLVTRRRTPS
ncbi:DUF3054 domain-containing protein [Nocardioides jishulii]|uniref:DUF3054 domain-containing protein n=1 Tax=Nocardioides jishulii TaxID=2575440 RepID=A0A4V5TKK4_9ACTN|nr:DUF3054 domain-containing protein [Nocardioides jishulii]QCX26243.1 DUF3054 family protein [Nocardioides jishulii]TKI63953.1 DUF3054 domain-containing protein [Nocardioides jishulii]